MNKLFEDYKKQLRDKRIAAVGLGISNRPLVKYLADQGMEVTGFDNASYEKLKDFVDEFSRYKNVRFFLGENCLDELSGFDVIFKTPAMRPDLKPFLREINRGAVLTSEIEALIENCPAEIFAVTGSDGKTTTTTLIGMMLEEQGYKVWVGGNIGTPLFDKLDEIDEDHKVVLELGSFQLQTLKKKSPGISVITNISPNHLDFHLSMEEYVDSKKNIYKHQDGSGRLILNLDNETTRGFRHEAKGEVLFFSIREIPEKGAYMKESKLYLRDGSRDTFLMNASEVKLKGLHNIENLLAAITAVDGHVDPESIRKVASGFMGVEHRMEYVKEVNGVSFYNDSIGSTPTRTCASLQAFDGKLILIAGGYDKHIPYDIMGELIAEKVKALVLIGQTGPLIKQAYLKETEKRNLAPVPIVEADRLSEAVQEAFKLAVKGDTVILSPASASYDMFPNFEIRGKLFKDCVNRL
ncbi:MAG: UDP-N-acetylmuramoyl-L-alanine--D-glutamate ligase [Clostridia bacterium]